MVNTSEYWEQRYREGTTRWDLGQAAPAFISLLQSHSLLPGKAAVLGSGRGYDAIAFAQYGFDVIGFDFAPAAIAEATAIAQTNGCSAKFLKRNIFDLPNEFFQYFHYVIEHTCFCAINPQQRQEYVKVVKEILQPRGELIAIFFTHSRPGGPPFGVSPEEIEQYFEADFEILKLQPIANSVPARQGEEHFGHFRLI
ncbi:methyltransferase domain-containing protein [Chroococcidiopsis sp. TS-821]|uniref:methyltransferase domain-containing protein n=1 Tax=Chroococcidiopsis sp. TS-821 TaxID=1378066 RepID=UPI000CEDE680|nr:methyltransferase domain-containing protein [Chroococcidiopsis sp. TS-821]PPS39844.1 SAM-dependent methyltransferase [Chroococcidiopsis sp. TS-821]